jgi:hypothetical protein
VYGEASAALRIVVEEHTCRSDSSSAALGTVEEDASFVDDPPAAMWIAPEDHIDDPSAVLEVVERQQTHLDDDLGPLLRHGPGGWPLATEQAHRSHYGQVKYLRRKAASADTLTQLHCTRLQHSAFGS